MTQARRVRFGLVWVALAVFTFESLAHQRGSLQLAAQAASV